MERQVGRGARLVGTLAPPALTKLDRSKNYASASGLARSRSLKQQVMKSARPGGASVLTSRNVAGVCPLKGLPIDQDTASGQSPPPKNKKMPAQPPGGFQANGCFGAEFLYKIRAGDAPNVIGRMSEPSGWQQAIAGIRSAFSTKGQQTTRPDCGRSGLKNSINLTKVDENIGGNHEVEPSR